MGISRAVTECCEMKDNRWSPEFPATVTAPTDKAFSHFLVTSCSSEHLKQTSAFAALFLV
jgi:hypothetical protein